MALFCLLISMPINIALYEYMAILFNKTYVHVIFYKFCSTIFSIINLLKLTYDWLMNKVCWERTHIDHKY